jgi:hypothetical protein
VEHVGALPGNGRYLDAHIGTVDGDVAVETPEYDVPTLPAVLCLAVSRRTRTNAPALVLRTSTTGGLTPAFVDLAALRREPLDRRGHPCGEAASRQSQ